MMKELVGRFLLMSKLSRPKTYPKEQVSFVGETDGLPQKLLL